MPASSSTVQGTYLLNCAPQALRFMDLDQAIKNEEGSLRNHGAMQLQSIVERSRGYVPSDPYSPDRRGSSELPHEKRSRTMSRTSASPKSASPKYPPVIHHCVAHSLP